MKAEPKSSFRFVAKGIFGANIAEPSDRVEGFIKHRAGRCNVIKRAYYISSILIVLITILCADNLAAQNPAGPPERVPNTTLRVPLENNYFDGFGLEDAFQGFNFQEPVVITSPPS